MMTIEADQSLSILERVIESIETKLSLQQFPSADNNFEQFNNFDQSKLSSTNSHLVSI